LLPACTSTSSADATTYATTYATTHATGYSRPHTSTAHSQPWPFAHAANATQPAKTSARTNASTG
jgi:hypothetical protein